MPIIISLSLCAEIPQEGPGIHQSPAGAGDIVANQSHRVTNSCLLLFNPSFTSLRLVLISPNTPPSNHCSEVMRLLYTVQGTIALLVVWTGSCGIVWLSPLKNHSFFVLPVVES